MKYKNILFVISALILAALACTVDINVPETNVKTGDTVTDLINIPSPDTGEVDLTVALGAGELDLNPGAQDGMVVGTITYNVPDFKPTIFEEGPQVKIEQGNLQLNGIPSFETDIKNEWNLSLSDRPITLRIKAGAYKGDFELGGLSLKNLFIEDGASNVKLSFSQPNLVDMGILDYSTGASSVDISGLANANFSTLVFKSGLGNYTLDFSGDLRRNANATIDSGLSNFRLVIPEGQKAKITVESGLTNVTTNGNWNKTENVYTQNGEGFSLTIEVDIGAGQLEIANR